MNRLRYTLVTNSRHLQTNAETVKHSKRFAALVTLQTAPPLARFAGLYELATLATE